MAVVEYQCRLIRTRKQFLGDLVEEEVGQPMAIRMDLTSTGSQVDGMLYAMRQNRGRPENVEQYKLRLFDGNGTVFRTIHVRADELERHNSGYLVSASGFGGDGADGSLAGASNEQLIAELRRRLGAAY